MTHALSHQVASIPLKPHCQWLRTLKRPLLLLSLSVGLFAGALPPVVTSASATPLNAANLPDGNYVFGESPVAGQPGSTYMVLQVQDRQVVGGFYQMSSSFDCFQGEVAGNNLALTILEAFEEPAQPYTLALATSSQQAAQQGGAELPVPVGFHALPELNELDYQILEACAAM